MLKRLSRANLEREAHLSCHLIPQWVFVFADDTFTTRSCHHAVAHKNLSEAVADSMAECRRPQQKNRRQHANTAKQNTPTVADLTPELTAEIQALYARDYELLGEYF